MVMDIAMGGGITIEGITIEDITIKDITTAGIITGDRCTTSEARLFFHGTLIAIIHPHR